MNVLLLNGSPHREGCTYTALSEIAAQLAKNGVDSEMIWIGNKPIADCIDCKGCFKTGKCVFKNDLVNETIDKLKAADGLVVGAPVYYAGPNAATCAFLDRLFYAKSSPYAGKLAACVVNCRRGGASASFDRINKYFTIARMPVVSSQYWNSTHGFVPADTKRDLEGLQTMRTLADNMAWLLKCIEAGRRAGIEMPKPERWIPTHFIMD